MANTIKLTFAGDSRQLDKTLSKVDKGVTSLGKKINDNGPDLGRSLGQRIVGGLASGMSAAGSVVGDALKSTGPYAIAGAAALGALLAPALMAGLAGGIIAGAGLGVLGLGVALLKEEPALVSAASRVRDKAVSVFQKAAQPLLWPFVNSVDKVGALLDRLGPTIAASFAAVVPAIAPLTDGLIALVEKAAPGFLAMLEASGPMLAELGPSLGLLGEAIAVFGEEIAAAGPEATIFFKDLIMWAGMTIIAVGKVISWFANLYVDLRKFFTESLPNWLDRVPGAIQNAFRGVVSWVGAPFRAAFNAVADYWNATIGSLRFSVPDWVPGIGGRSFGGSRMPKFHTGGTVPGAPGQETVAVLQAGERVLNRPNADRPAEIVIRADDSATSRFLLALLQDAIGQRGGDPVRVLSARA